MTPRYLVSCTSSISFPLTWKQGVISDVLFICPSFWAEPIIMVCVLTIFKESLLPCNHSPFYIQIVLSTDSFDSITQVEFNNVIVAHQHMGKSLLNGFIFRLLTRSLNHSKSDVLSLDAMNFRKQKLFSGSLGISNLISRKICESAKILMQNRSVVFTRVHFHLTDRAETA